jgi:uncharacterized glyoxalase superfamily protein PhnB
MAEKISPMIHVPDVPAAIDWYRAVGFTVAGTHEDEGVMNWASLSFGESRLMLSIGGKPSAEPRREVDLYVQVNDVDALFHKLDGKVELVEGLHDTFYGMREFIVRDLNRFWVTFGQPIG